MFPSIHNGSQLILASLRVFVRYPSLLMPLIVCWVVYVPIIIYLKFFFEWNRYSVEQQFSIIFFVIILLSFILSSSCFILLAIMEQIETSGSPNFFKAFLSASKNVFKAFPVVAIWAIVWFIITIVESFFRAFSQSGSETDLPFNAENVAHTVAGLEKLSLPALFFRALEKGVRMIAFLIYPAIAWEKYGFLRATKKGLAVAVAHKIEFATGVVLTELAAIIVFLPPGIVFFFSKRFSVDFPDVVWFATIIYCCFAWSFSIFLEQLFTAELYRWHIRWEEACEIAVKNGEEPPTLNEITRPSVLDTTPSVAMAMMELDKAKKNCKTPR